MFVDEEEDDHEVAVPVAAPVDVEMTESNDKESKASSIASTTDHSPESSVSRNKLSALRGGILDTAKNEAGVLLDVALEESKNAFENATGRNADELMTEVTLFVFDL